MISMNAMSNKNMKTFILFLIYDVINSEEISFITSSPMNSNMMNISIFACCSPVTKNMRSIQVITTSVICSSVIVFVMVFPVSIMMRDIPMSIDAMPILRFMGVGLRRTITPAVMNIAPMMLLCDKKGLLE